MGVVVGSRSVRPYPLGVDTLAATLADAHRAYAAFRPEVAQYLYERGFRPLEGDPRLLEAIFRLQMESIGSRAFGVSNDGWRDNAEWPDRYFPILWLDIVPKLLPLLAPERRLDCITLLFNLGENLVTAAPTLGGAVAEALRHSIADLARDPHAAATRALATVGILPRSALASGAKTTIRRVASVLLATWDRELIPGAVGFHADSFWVADRVRPIALQFTMNAQLVARIGTAGLVAHTPGRLRVTEVGEVLHGTTSIGHIDPRGVAAAAANDDFIVITRRFSQCVELWSAT